MAAVESPHGGAVPYQLGAEDSDEYLGLRMGVGSGVMALYHNHVAGSAWLADPVSAAEEARLEALTTATLEAVGAIVAADKARRAATAAAAAAT